MFHDFMSGNIIVDLIILLFSAIIHEVSHGLMAERLGDDTARIEGRITLNPIPHIDPYGSILLPLIMWVSTGGRFVFASAKPVPVNFNNLRNPRSGMILVSLAGPFSNFLLAIVFGLIIKFGLTNAISLPILIDAAFINLLLGTFNLIPIPPLDGSKILLALAPRQLANSFLRWEQFGFVLILLFVFLGLFQYILAPVVTLYSQIFGIRFF
jgi:Zn-dependent protease